MGSTAGEKGARHCRRRRTRHPHDAPARGRWAHTQAILTSTLRTLSLCSIFFFFFFLFVRLPPPETRPYNSPVVPPLVGEPFVGALELLGLRLRLRGDVGDAELGPCILR